MILCTESGSLHDLLYCMTFCIAYLFTITEQYYCVWCSQTFIISAVMCMVCAISCCCSVHWEQPLLSTAHMYQLHTRALWQGGVVTHNRYQYCIAGLLRKKILWVCGYQWKLFTTTWGRVTSVMVIWYPSSFVLPLKPNHWWYGTLGTKSLGNRSRPVEYDN